MNILLILELELLRKNDFMTSFSSGLYTQNGEKKLKHTENDFSCSETSKFASNILYEQNTNWPYTDNFLKSTQVPIPATKFQILKTSFAEFI